MPSLLFTGAQLDLPFWRKGTLKEALDAYSRMKMPYLTPGTLKSHAEHRHWLLARLGENTPLREITLETLERVWESERTSSHGLMGITVRHRLFYLRAAAKYAAQRRVISKDDIPEMPLVPNDTRPGQRVLGVEEYGRFRAHLVDRYVDFADIGMWTGHRTIDAQTMIRAHLEPDYEWKDADGHVVALGRFWRRTSKTSRGRGRNTPPPGWIIMEPEARIMAQRILARPGSPDSYIVGHVWGAWRAFASACDRAQIPRVSPNRDLRRSFASMLLARGYDETYIQMALGHVGAPEFSVVGHFVRTHGATVAERHYMRPTPELAIRQARLRRSESSASAAL